MSVMLYPCMFCVALSRICLFWDRDYVRSVLVAIPVRLEDNVK